MTRKEELEFPCGRLPEDAGAARLLGIYPMCVDGLYMQRVKVPAGVLGTDALRVLAGAAAKYTPQYPLHLTTRQDVEIHGIRPKDLGAVQAAVSSAALTGLGACGDTLRNVAVCPGCGLCPGSRDVSALALAVNSAAEAQPFIREMPRKFKISLSGCEKACARPWINDLGLVAKKDGAFEAIIAGSLGARPGTGVRLYESLDSGQVVPLAVALLKLFNAEGDRKVRSKARLRHVRERLGDQRFKAAVEEAFRTELAERAPEAAEVPVVEEGFPCAARLLLPLGDIAPAEALELADAVDKFGASLRIGFEHDLWLYSRQAVELGPALSRFAAGPAIVSCPGSAWCARGIADSRAAASAIGDMKVGRGLSISISGCPNNCSHAAVADIGLVGLLRTIDGERRECFRLFAGGGKGASKDLAEELHPAVPAASLAAVVNVLSRRFRGAVGGNAPLGPLLDRQKDDILHEIAAIVADCT